MKRKVLVVEDDFDTQRPLAELLRIKGYNVTTASDAEQALTEARRLLPDLIITDIVLPGKSGLHFIHTVRGDERLKATPIIVISGCGPMILVEAESAGADVCLEKPIRMELFWDALERVLTAAPPSAAREEPARNLAGRIDALVEELHNCASKEEREGVLKELKKQILEMQQRGRPYAG